MKQYETFTYHSNGDPKSQIQDFLKQKALQGFRFAGMSQTQNGFLVTLVLIMEKDIDDPV